MSPARLLAVLRHLRPEDHASAPDYARRVRLEWRILSALTAQGHLRPIEGRPWTRQQLLEEAIRPRLVLVVDEDASGEHDTVM